MPDVLTPLTLATGDDLPPFIPADWVSQIAVTTSYQTDVTKSGTTLTEERRALSLRPFRDVRVRLTGMTQQQSYRLLHFMLRRTRARLPVPLYCDQSEVTASSAGTTINCVTTDRRFFAGGRVVIYKPLGADVAYDTGPARDFVEYARIDSLTASALTLKGADALTLTYPAGSIVMPVIDAEVSLGAEGMQGINLLTDGIAFADVEASEVLGPSSLPQEATGNPAGFQTYNGYPILDMDPDWSNLQSVLLSHDGTSEQAGRTNFIWSQGTTHRVGFVLTFSAEVRANAAAIRRFFDSRVGRLKQFYVISPQSFFSITARGANYIDITDITFIDDSVLPHVGVVLADGTQYVYAVSTIAHIAGGWRITFTTNTDVFAVSDVARVSAAHFVRFSSDSIEEMWDSDGACAIALNAIELIAEDDVVIPDA